MRRWQTRTLGMLCAVLLAACSANDTSTKRTAEAASPASGTGAFLDACSDGHDCAGGLCLGLTSGEGVCTHACTRDIDCPHGSNWACGATAETTGAVCVCVADGSEEVCGDGRDNDCNGKLDDCMTCGARLIQPDDRLHCGSCGHACPAGSVCQDRVCVCPEGAADCSLDADTCHEAADCDDHVQCTEDACVAGQCSARMKAERCGEGTSCDPRAALCVAGAVCASSDDCGDADPCTVNERCDAAARRCAYDVLDGDGDGHPPTVCGGDDCNDSDFAVYPGASELCDGLDNDCDAAKDEQLAAGVCGDGFACVQGKCTCAPGRVACADDCLDLSRDSENCGTCGNACSAGSICRDGLCTCPAGSLLCRGECRAPDSFDADMQHCGGCGLPCAADTEVCQHGQCVCATGTTACGSACVAPLTFQTSSAHCGGCGRACDGTCVDGACATAASVVAGVSSTCVLFSDTRAACFGLVGGSTPRLLRDERGEAITGIARIVLNDGAPAPYLCALRTDGVLLCGGDALLRERTDATVLRPIFAQGLVPLDHVIDVQLGADASCVLLADGRVFCWGPNTEGGIGAGTSGESALAMPVQTESGVMLEDASAIALFPFVGQACAVRASGGVVCWGANQNGEAVTGAATRLLVGTAVRGALGGALSAVRSVAVGAGASCAVLADGSVSCWGSNAFGQLGRDTTDSSGIAPGSVVDATGHTFVGASAVYSQYGAFCALGAGDVQCWGANGQGQLGEGSTVTRAYASLALRGVTMLALGLGHHCALRAGGALLCWGDSALHGSASGAGTALFPRPVRDANGNEIALVRSVAAGGQHSCLLDQNAGLACWGDNSQGQLGGTDARSSAIPLSVRWP